MVEGPRVVCTPAAKERSHGSPSVSWKQQGVVPGTHGVTSSAPASATPQATNADGRYFKRERAARARPDMVATSRQVLEAVSAAHSCARRVPPSAHGPRSSARTPQLRPCDVHTWIWIQGRTDEAHPPQLRPCDVHTWIWIQGRTAEAHPRATHGASSALPASCVSGAGAPRSMQARASGASRAQPAPWPRRRGVVMS